MSTHSELFIQFRVTCCSCKCCLLHCWLLTVMWSENFPFVNTNYGSNSVQWKRRCRLRNSVCEHEQGHLFFGVNSSADRIRITAYLNPPCNSLRRRSAAARLPRPWVRIPRGTWISIFCVCYVVSGRDLCDDLIPRPEESYLLWCVVECDLESSWMRMPGPNLGLLRQKNCNNRYSIVTDCTVRG
jgi:hypothetical protein